MYSLNITFFKLVSSAELFYSFAGNSKKHIAALKKAVDMNCQGEPSLYNSLNLAMQTLKLVCKWGFVFSLFSIIRIMLIVNF